jgi:hypothetical protein
MENEELSKTAFAALLYRQPGVKPFEAALSLFPDTGVALRVSQEWPGDKFVLSELARFAGEDSAQENYTPGKEDLCKEVWEWVAGAKSSQLTFDERIKAAKLYAELNEMIKKPEPAKVETNVNNFAVAEIPVYASENDWERALQENQNGLMIEGQKLIAAEVSTNAEA